MGDFELGFYPSGENVDDDMDVPSTTSNDDAQIQKSELIFMLANLNAACNALFMILLVGVVLNSSVRRIIDVFFNDLNLKYIFLVILCYRRISFLQLLNYLVVLLCL